MPLLSATITCGSSVLSEMSGSLPSSMSFWRAESWSCVSVPRSSGCSRPEVFGALNKAATSSCARPTAVAIARASADTSGVGLALDVGFRTTNADPVASGAKSTAPSTVPRPTILPVPSTDTILPVASTARISGGESA